MMPRSIYESFEAFGRMMREILAEAIAADPGFLTALRQRQRWHPDMGWLDVAAYREDAIRVAFSAGRSDQESGREYGSNLPMIGLSREAYRAGWDNATNRLESIEATSTAS